MASIQVAEAEVSTSDAGALRNKGLSDAKKKAKIEEHADSFINQRPEVPELTPAQVVKVRNSNPNVVLVDVRTAPEQEVSQIPGAITSEVFLKNQADYQDKQVVCYCTIGLRSGQFAKKLRSQNIDAVNMRGSILAWTHEGLPLENTTDGTETKRLHVYAPFISLEHSDYEAIYFPDWPLKLAWFVASGTLESIWSRFRSLLG